MNIQNMAIALALIGISLIATIFSEGLALPFTVPLFFYGFKLMGVKLE